MSEFAFEAQAWAEAQRERERTALQIAALRLCCGLDLPDALRQAGGARQQMIRRVKRFIERERLRGAGGRADYNLDRHIALSQSLAMLEAAGKKGNGAQRRRR